MEAKMTLWEWVAFMNYPAKTESSPAESDGLQNGIDFTEVLDEKRTEFIKAKQEKPAEEPVSEQNELLEMMRTIFTDADKEELLSLLVELAETGGVSWKEMLPAKEKNDMELRVTLPKKEVAEEQRPENKIVSSREEKHRLNDLIRSLTANTAKEDLLPLLAELEEVQEIARKERLPAKERPDIELRATIPKKKIAEEQQPENKIVLSKEEKHRLDGLIRSLTANTAKEDLLPLLAELEEAQDISRKEILTAAERADTKIHVTFPDKEAASRKHVFHDEESQVPVEKLQEERNTKFLIGEAYYYPEDIKKLVGEKDLRAESLVESIPKAELVETILTLIHSMPKETKEELLTTFTGETEQMSKMEPERLAGEFSLNFTNNITVNRPVDLPELEREVNELFAKVEQQLTQIKTQEDVAKIAPKVLEYLMAWQQMSEKADNQVELMPLVIRESNPQTPVIWQDLVKLYQQKMNFHTKSVYALESKVTNTDIVRWLSNTLNLTVHQEQPVAPIPTEAQVVQMPISQVEQIVIHLPQNSDNNQAGKALLEQFNRFVDMKSLVSQQPKGQLAITLKPANLGEMLVRFTQVDGEMLVKIMVTSKAAKEMLEAHSQQLRHMFAPHQVVIERNDSNVQQAQAAYKEEGQAEEQEQGDQSSSGNQKEKDDNETFASLFDELILNEKV